MKKVLENCITEQKKLRSYAEFKTVIKFETYLNTIMNQKTRVNLTRFRMGVSDLEIEKGRYKTTPMPREFRFCKLCQSIKIQAVEDEKHFLLHCPFYISFRNVLYKYIERKYKKLSTLESNEIYMVI